MNLTRRGMLKRIIAGSAIALVPFSTFAKWMESAFRSETYAGALKDTIDVPEDCPPAPLMLG